MDDQHATIYQLNDGDLLAFLDGTARPVAAAHIASCPICLAEASALQGMAALFGAALERTDCPSAATLLEYQAGVLPASQRQPVASHLASCADCQAELALLVAATETAPRRSLLDQLQTSGRQLLQALLLPASTPVLAVRGSAARQLRYQAASYQIMLALVPAAVGSSSWALEGQVSEEASGEPALVGAMVVLRKGTAQVASDTVDDTGFFACEGLAAGVYQLQLVGDTAEVLIDNVMIRA